MFKDKYILIFGNGWDRLHRNVPKEIASKDMNNSSLKPNAFCI